jgi:transposase, IS6 family
MAFTKTARTEKTRTVTRHFEPDEELVPAACHVTEQYGNNLIEADHGLLKFRLRAMRGLKQLRCARVISAGHAFIQNIRRGHYELGTEETVSLRVLAAFDELALAI